MKINIMKKIFFKNSKNLNLVGSLWPSSSDAIIIMAHGSGGNRFAKGLFEKIAEDFQNHGYNVLSFDFSGHGESDDAIENMPNSIDDLKSAISYVKKEGYERIALFGHSYGAFICLKCFSQDIETMILLGPLTGPVNWNWESICTPEQIIEMNKIGYIEYPINDGLRKTIKFDANLFREIAEINQEETIKQITSPVLIIHGDGDKEELDLLNFSKKAISLLPKKSELQLIKGASHNFLNHTNEVINLSINWLKTYLPIK